MVTLPRPLQRVQPLSYVRMETLHKGNFTSHPIPQIIILGRRQPRIKQADFVKKAPWYQQRTTVDKAFENSVERPLYQVMAFGRPAKYPSIFREGVEVANDDA